MTERNIRKPYLVLMQNRKPRGRDACIRQAVLSCGFDCLSESKCEYIFGEKLQKKTQKRRKNLLERLMERSIMLSV